MLRPSGQRRPGGNDQVNWFVNIRITKYLFDPCPPKLGFKTETSRLDNHVHLRWRFVVQWNCEVSRPCLTEQPGMKLRLCTNRHELSVTERVSLGIVHEGTLGIRITNRWYGQ